MTRTDPNDAIQSLARIAQAATRMMARLHWSAVVADPNEEIAHMQANLDRVREAVDRGRDGH